MRGNGGGRVRRPYRNSSTQRSGCLVLGHGRVLEGERDEERGLRGLQGLYLLDERGQSDQDSHVGRGRGLARPGWR